MDTILAREIRVGDELHTTGLTGDVGVAGQKWSPVLEVGRAKPPDTSIFVVLGPNRMRLVCRPDVLLNFRPGAVYCGTLGTLGKPIPKDIRARMDADRKQAEKDADLRRATQGEALLAVVRADWEWAKGQRSLNIDFADRPGYKLRLEASGDEEERLAILRLCRAAPDLYDVLSKIHNCERLDNGGTLIGDRLRQEIFTALMKVATHVP